MRFCEVDGCGREHKATGLCHGHYQRVRRTGRLDPEVPLRGARRGCEVPDCDRPAHARGVCQTHYKRLLQHGDVRADQPIATPTGQGWISHGYRWLPVAPPERWLVGGETSSLEHRLVMARGLRRPLADDEVVHHVNGDRLDNRPANLELWSTAQPKGQRIADKVSYARSILRRYAPHELREDPK